MLAILVGGFLLALSAATGLLATDLFTPDLPPLERRVLGLVTGVALLTIACYLSALVAVLLFAPGLLAVIAGVLVWKRFLTVQVAPAFEPVFETASLVDRSLAALAIVFAFAVFALPLLLRPMPQGWDPAFHSAIVDSIRRLGALPTTWGPYEPGEKFNYPAALHAVLALFSRLAGLAPDRAFTFGFLTLGALMLLAVHALGVRFGGSVRAGALSVLVYGLCDGWGTLAGHAAWGGLPNLAGLVLMAGFVLAVSRPSRGAMVLAAICAAASAFTHHLSFALLGFTFVVLLALELVTERKPSAVGRAAFFALTLAVLTAGVLVLARPSGRFDLAQAFKFERERITDALKAWEVMGPVLLGGGLVGLVFALFTHREPERRLLPVWAIGLLAFWVGWDMVYRAAIWWLVHGSWTALTPSRGLTDAAVPLAICLAILLATIADRLPGRWPAAMVVVVAIGLSILGYRAERERIHDAPSSRGAFADARALCHEVKLKTPEGSVLFAPNAGEVGTWLPYLCGRELNYFPDPGYYQSPYREAKMRLQDPSEFARYMATQGSKPLFYATRATAEFPLVASAGGWNLYRIAP